MKQKLVLEVENSVNNLSSCDVLLLQIKLYITYSYYDHPQLDVPHCLVQFMPSSTFLIQDVLAMATMSNVHHAAGQPTLL